MQRILSEAEYTALKNRADQAETIIQELALAKATIQTLESSVDFDWHKHANFWREKYQSIGRRTINLGTYPTAVANDIVKQLKKMQNNDNLRTTKIKRVRRKGRGHRFGFTKNHRDIRASIAEKQAIYIDLPEPTEEKK